MDSEHSPSRIRNSSVFIRDLRLSARLGVYRREEADEQPINLNVELGTSIKQAVSSGRLADTSDYVGIADIVRAVVSRRHYRLAESLAHTIAQEVLAASAADWVRVRLDKIGCLTDAKAAGVEVVIDRDRKIDHPQPLDAVNVRKPEEVVILGGGVAGFSAALWVHRLGHRALLVDGANQLGGQLQLVHRPMPDLPALNPLTGAELARRLWQQFNDNEGRWLQRKIRCVALEGDAVALQPVGDGAAIHCSAAIICTGLRRNSLGVPGEQKLKGRGLLTTAARGIEELRDRQVVVIGGGDSACENALLLAGVKARVTLVHRGEVLNARAQFCRRVTRSKRIDIRLGHGVRAFVGDRYLSGVEVERPDGELEKIVADAALVRVGWCPNTALLPTRWLDDRGFVRVDRHGRVEDAERIFSAGDVTDPHCLSVAAAMGSGAIAARAACSLLERYQ